MARLSSNEREFIETALRQELRIDGRGPFDSRRTLINFAKEDGAVEVQQGETRVLAVVSAQLGPPYPDRPNEGSFAIYTEFSPMADPSFEPGRPGELAVELGRVIDRGLRESRAVDTESLCVLAGKAVWALRIDIHILDNGGNLIDVANMAALAGLLSFRRPDVSLGGAEGQEVIVHPSEVRDPLPLTLHHLPVAVSFGFFADGELVVLDPSLKEELVMGGRLTITVNAHGEVCAVQKGGGVGVRMSEILRCMRIASSKAIDTAALLKRGAETHELERAQRKIRRRRLPNDSVIPVQIQEPSVNDGDIKDVQHIPMDSDTDSEDEMPDVKPSEGDGLFQGGNSAWNHDTTKPLDAQALEELDMVAKLSTETHMVSAAAVYRQNPPQKKELGPVFSANTDVETTEEAQAKPDSAPTSLLDAVKKKTRKRKKANKQES